MKNSSRVIFVKEENSNDFSVYLNNGSYFQAPIGVYFYGEFSISVWVKAVSYSEYARILDFGNGVNSDNVIFSLFTTTSNFSPMSGIFSGATRKDLCLNNLISLEFNKWVHLIWVFDGVLSSLYANGTLLANAPANLPRNVTRNKNYIGKSSWSNDGVTNAYMKEIKIFNRALSPSEFNLH